MEPKDVTILVVDDVNAIRVQVKDLLKGLGYRSVVVASSGEEAKEILQSQPIHLILCDWQMTPTSGIDLLKHCRSTIDHCDIAFIMVTASNTQEEVVEAVQAGVDDYIVKPLTIDQIQSKVLKVFIRKKVFQ